MSSDLKYREVSICHNDDDCKDPNHRRVLLYYENGAWYAEDTREPLFYVPDNMSARCALESVYGAECWDLRIEWSDAKPHLKGQAA